MRWLVRWRTTWPEEAERTMLVSDFTLRLGRGTGAFVVGPTELVSVERIGETAPPSPGLSGTPVSSDPGDGCERAREEPSS